MPKLSILTIGIFPINAKNEQIAKRMKPMELEEEYGYLKTQMKPNFEELVKGLITSK